MRQGMLQATHRPEKIHALTSLRFFAALFVVCFHAISVSTFVPSITHESLLGRVIGLGYTSVSFFFLLSGYILGVVYLRRSGPVAAGPFFRARFARVYPLFFLTLVVDAPYSVMGDVARLGVKSALLRGAETLTGDVLMLQAWMLRLRFINEPSWSLSVEAIFYLSFPLLGVLLWRLRGAGLWITAALLYCGGQAVVALGAHHTQSELLKRLPLLHMTTFALGILLARWQWLRMERRGNGGRSGFGATYAALAAVAVCSVAVVYWSPRISVFNLHDGLLAPIFLVVIWMFSQSQWPVARLLSAPWLVVLGEASYGLYLIHLPVFHFFEWLGWTRIPALFPLYLAVSIVLSVLSFYFFETPVRKWILKRGKTHVKETIEAASDAQ